MTTKQLLSFLLDCQARTIQAHDHTTTAKLSRLIADLIYREAMTA